MARRYCKYLNKERVRLKISKEELNGCKQQIKDLTALLDSVVNAKELRY